MASIPLPPGGLAADQGYIYRASITAADGGGFPNVPATDGVTRFRGWPRMTFVVNIKVGAGTYQAQTWRYDETLGIWVPEQALSATNTASVIDVLVFRFMIPALKIISLGGGMTLEVSATPHIE